MEWIKYKGKNGNLMDFRTKIWMVKKGSIGVLHKLPYHRNLISLSYFMNRQFTYPFEFIESSKTVIYDGKTEVYAFASQSGYIVFRLPENSAGWTCFEVNLKLYNPELFYMPSELYKKQYESYPCSLRKFTY